MTTRNTMKKWAGGWGWVVTLSLLISLASNILGLILPFLEIHEAFKSEVTYSLPHSVHLMWTSKLYFIAALILGFSIIFPFVKLASLFAAWFIPWKPSSRVTFLHWIELLGKWSFMDIFVVILLISLTANQSFISSNIHLGVYFFIGAITLSMIVSQIVLSMARKMVSIESTPPTYSSKRKWMVVDNHYLGWTVPVLTLLSVGALIEAIHAPFLQIHQFFLVSRTFSITSITELLQTNNHVVLLIILVWTVATIPLLRFLILLVSWLIPMKIGHHIRANMFIEGLSRWSMLDVFGLSLFLVATEGKELVKTETLPGLRVVVAAIALTYILGFVAVCLHKSVLKNESFTEAS